MAHVSRPHSPATQLLLSTTLMFSCLETQSAANSHSGESLLSGLTAELAYITKHAIRKQKLRKALLGSADDRL